MTNIQGKDEMVQVVMALGKSEGSIDTVVTRLYPETYTVKTLGVTVFHINGKLEADGWNKVEGQFYLELHHTGERKLPEGHNVTMLAYSMSSVVSRSAIDAMCSDAGITGLRIIYDSGLESEKPASLGEALGMEHLALGNYSGSPN